MQRHASNFAWFFVGVVLSVALLLPSKARATAPVSITWSLGMTPTQDCLTTFSAYAAPDIVYGFPVIYRCTTGAGTYVAARGNTPSCPTGFVVDFQNLLCVPSESVLESLGSMTVSEASTIAASILALWALAWGYRQVAQVIHRSDSNEES